MARIVDDELAIGDQVLIRHGRGRGLVGAVDQIVEGFEYSSQDVIFVKVPGLEGRWQTRRRDLQYASDAAIAAIQRSSVTTAIATSNGQIFAPFFTRRRVRPTPVATAPSLAPAPGPSKRKREVAAVAEFSNAVDALQEKGKIDEQEWKTMLELGMKLYNA